MEVLEPWLHQRFLGAPATFGDDRSLTNFIMRRYRVIYNPNAACTTLVPERWKKYLIQQVRWKKSWLRETLIAGSFMPAKNPLAALSCYIAALCSVLSPWMVGRAFYYGATDDPTLLLHYLLGLIILGLTISLYVYWRRPRLRWLLGVFIVAIQVVLMGPQTYYAFLTMRKNHWGTR